MPLKKYVNGSWVDSSYRRYETGTDTVTNLPVEILTDGQPVTSWTMKGNTTTSGTPSPQNPVTISGVGNETANLYNNAETNWTSGVKDSNGIIGSSTTSHFTSNYTAVESSTKYSITGIYATGSSTAARIYFYDSSKVWISRTEPLRDNPLVFETPNNCEYIQIQAANGVDGTNFMLVKGEYTSETMPSFEPYGRYKISILKDLQALTPIYLSQPLRKSLDGTAFDTLDSTGLVTYNVDEYGQPQTATTETVAVPTITTTGGAVTLDVDTTIKPSEMSLTYHGWHEHEPLKYNNGSWS